MVDKGLSLTPIDGWGFAEHIDGRLAPTFSIELTAEGVEFGSGVRGWHGTAIDGKYAGADLRMNPRNDPWSGVVVLRINDPETGSELFYGLAQSEGLETSWSNKE